MNPNAPEAPPPYDPGSRKPQSGYEFLADPDKPKKSWLPGGNSRKNRIVIAAFGGVVLVMLIIMVAGLISNAGKGDAESLMSAAKQQHELIRIADIGVKKSRGQAAKNLAVTTKLSMQSQQSEMLSAVRTYNKKFGQKELIAGQNNKTDDLLTAAEQNNRFDEEFIAWMEQNLAQYQNTLKQAYDGASSNKLKAALSSQYQSANTLAGITQPETN